MLWGIKRLALLVRHTKISRTYSPFRASRAAWQAYQDHLIGSLKVCEQKAQLCKILLRRRTIRFWVSSSQKYCSRCRITLWKDMTTYLSTKDSTLSRCTRDHQKIGVTTGWSVWPRRQHLRTQQWKITRRCRVRQVTIILSNLDRQWRIKSMPKAHTR